MPRSPSRTTPSVVRPQPRETQRQRRNVALSLPGFPPYRSTMFLHSTIIYLKHFFPETCPSSSYTGTVLYRRDLTKPRLRPIKDCPTPSPPPRLTGPTCCWAGAAADGQRPELRHRIPGVLPLAGLNLTPTPYGKFHRGASLRFRLGSVRLSSIAMAALWFGFAVGRAGSASNERPRRG